MHLNNKLESFSSPGNHISDVFNFVMFFRTIKIHHHALSICVGNVGCGSTSVQLRLWTPPCCFSLQVHLQVRSRSRQPQCSGAVSTMTVRADQSRTPTPNPVVGEAGSFHFFVVAPRHELLWKIRNPEVSPYLLQTWIRGGCRFLVVVARNSTKRSPFKYVRGHGPNFVFPRAPIQK